MGASTSDSKKRSPGNTKIEEGQSIIRTTKGSLLLVGMIKCGHCDSPLTTTWNQKSYVLKDGTKKIYRSAKYRCSGKAHQKVECTGQTIYSPNKIEGIVLDELYGYLDQLKVIDLANQIKNLKKKNTTSEVKLLNMHQNSLDRANQDLTSLKAEVIKVINGESSFDRNMLSDMIKDKESQISGHKNQVSKAELELKSKKIEYAEMDALQKYVPVWREVFYQASTEKKKMMISTIIGGIHVHRDKIEINLKLHIREFLSAMNNSTTQIKKIDNNKEEINSVLSYNSFAIYP